MDKRYQVFVSSTFKDLEEERSVVIQTLMEMDCIPAGMELFPAIDEQQWEFIKKIIDDCDYYLLVIAGRYGTTTANGKSYTEMEFDYAIEQGKRAVVFVHSDLASLPVSKSEPDPIARQKLEDFIKRATDGRLMKTWSNADDLAGKVSVSLQKTIKTYPAIGWVRADKVTNNEALSDLMELRKENSILKSKIQELERESELVYSGGIAEFNSPFEIHYTTSPAGDYYAEETSHSVFMTWEGLYHFLSPYIHKNLSTTELFNKLTTKIEKDNNVPGDYYTSIDESDLITIELQLTALGLVDTSKGRWRLTPKGIEKMMEVRVIK